MLLGNKLDKVVKNEQAMFLPDYLLKGFDSAGVNGLSLIKSKNTILTSVDNGQNEKPWFRPFIATLLVLLIIAGLQFTKTSWASTVLNIFDRLFFFTLGAMGFLMLFMWFGTDHTLCGNNFNLLWAWPTHLPIAFILDRRKKWIKNYFKVSAIFYFLLFFTWSLLPQDMNSAIVPLVVLAFIRSSDRYRKIKL